MMKRSWRVPIYWVKLVVLCAVYAVHPLAVRAQCTTFPGDKAVYGSSTTVNTPDYIDASTLVDPAHPSDVCYAIKQALIQLGNAVSNGCPTYNGSGVIDARGISASGPALSCANANNPFTGTGGADGGFNVTVLLPAGTIDVGATWILPSNTRLIGEGSLAATANLPTNAVTKLQAGGIFNGTAMIDMGDDPLFNDLVCSGYNCHGISIEHLGLDGGNVTGLGGIYNNTAQELNYVNDVALTNMNGTGLMIVGGNVQLPGKDIFGNNNTGHANNSGPYTKIYFSGSGTCVNVNGTNNIRGLNGLSCNGTGAGPAILLDARNTVIQNVSISGYTDGILIGSQNGTYTQDDLVLSITGSSSVTNVVHITNATDVTAIGISGGSHTIVDNVTNSTIPGAVGLYVLGEPMMNGSAVLGYSRFTTSITYPAWFQGTNLPGTGCSGFANGSLYSVTGTISSGQSTLWGCIAGNWSALSSQ